MKKLDKDQYAYDTAVSKVSYKTAGNMSGAGGGGVRASLFELQNSGLTVFLDNDFKSKVRDMRY